MRRTLEDLEAALGPALDDEAVAEAFMLHASAVLDMDEPPMFVHVGGEHLAAAVGLLTAFLDEDLFEQILTETDAAHKGDQAWRLGVLCATLQLAADALSLPEGRGGELSVLGEIVNARLEAGHYDS